MPEPEKGLGETVPSEPAAPRPEMPVLPAPTPSGDGAADRSPERPSWWGEFFVPGTRVRLIKLAYVIGARNSHDAEEAADAAILAVRLRAVKDPPLVNPMGYAYSVVRTHLIRVYQRELRREELEDRFTGRVTAGTEDCGFAVIEDNDWVEKILKTLSQRQRQVMTLILEGLKIPEIAKQLGLTDTNVSTHFNNARTRLMNHPEIRPLRPRNTPAPPGRHRQTPTSPEQNTIPTSSRKEYLR